MQSRISLIFGKADDSRAMLAFLLTGVVIETISSESDHHVLLLSAPTESVLSTSRVRRSKRHSDPDGQRRNYHNTKNESEDYVPAFVAISHYYLFLLKQEIDIGKSMSMPVIRHGLVFSMFDKIKKLLEYLLLFRISMNILSHLL